MQCIDMHHPVFGVNFLLHSVSLILIILLLLFSLHSSRLTCSIITTLTIHHPPILHLASSEQ